MTESNQGPESKAITEQQVQEQLFSILNSDAFRGANKLHKFLRYILEMYCAGRSTEIKQYTVGVKAFSLGEDFDPQHDPVVRIEAGRLRRRLVEYYAGEGSQDQLLIEVPKGSYVPKLRLLSDVRPALSGQAVDTDKPSEANELSLAVLPFENMSNDRELDYFCDGITEEVISTLSLYEGFTVLPRWAARKFTHMADEPERLAGALKIRYLVEGSVRKAGECVRITARLNGATDRAQLWSDTYNATLTLENILSLQDDIARQVTTSIANEYSGILPRKVTGMSLGGTVSNYSAYEAMLRMHHYNLNASAEIYAQTKYSIQNALENEPNHPMLLSALAELKIDGYTMFFAKSDKLPIDECTHLLNKARSVDPDCYYVYFVLGLLKVNQRRASETIEVAHQLQTFQHNPSALALAGWFMALAGEWDKGLALLDQQLRELRFYPGWLRHARFLHHYKEGRYEEALVEALQFGMPGLLWDPLDRAAALGRLGDLTGGTNAIQELVTLCPTFFKEPKRYLSCYIMFDDLLEEVLKGIELAT